MTNGKVAGRGNGQTSERLTSGSLAVLPDRSRFIRGVFVDAERGRAGAAPIAPEGMIAAPADRKASNDPASGRRGRSQPQIQGRCGPLGLS